MEKPTQHPRQKGMNAKPFKENRPKRAAWGLVFLKCVLKAKLTESMEYQTPKPVTKWKVYFWRAGRLRELRLPSPCWLTVLFASIVTAQFNGRGSVRSRRQWFALSPGATSGQPPRHSGFSLCMSTSGVCVRPNPLSEEAHHSDASFFFFCLNRIFKCPSSNTAPLCAAEGWASAWIWQECNSAHSWTWSNTRSSRRRIGERLD